MCAGDESIVSGYRLYACVCQPSTDLAAKCLLRRLGNALVGNSTAQMKHQVFSGDSAHGTRGAVGIYARTFTVPPCTIPGAKHIFTVDQVSRIAMAISVRELRRPPHIEGRGWAPTQADHSNP